jgi:thiol-disulfide isomerase/thioredoxin
MAPWCGHCKKMKPQWDRLQEEYQDHKTVVVAEFDCTTDSGKDFCKDRDIKGFPTLKTGDPTKMELYRGDRDYGSLKAHIQLELDFPCNPDRIDLCTARQKALLEEFMKLDDDELEDKIDEAYGELYNIEEDFEMRTKMLKKERRKLKKKMDETVLPLKTQIDWIREIKSSRNVGVRQDGSKEEL